MVRSKEHAINIIAARQPVPREYASRRAMPWLREEGALPFRFHRRRRAAVICRCHCRQRARFAARDARPPARSATPAAPYFLCAAICLLFLPVAMPRLAPPRSFHAVDAAIFGFLSPLFSSAVRIILLPPCIDVISQLRHAFTVIIRCQAVRRFSRVVRYTCVAYAMMPMSREIRRAAQDENRVNRAAVRSKDARSSLMLPDLPPDAIFFFFDFPLIYLPFAAAIAAYRHATYAAAVTAATRRRLRHHTPCPDAGRHDAHAINALRLRHTPPLLVAFSPSRHR